MKNLFLMLFATLSFIGYAQTNSDWEKVIITRNPEDIKGLKRLNDVSAETSRLYGKQSKLRDETTKKIKQEAAKIGATIVLITVDNFAMTPINNVNMVGTAYSGEVSQQEEKVLQKAEVSGEKVSEEDIIITRNPDGKQSKLRDEATKKLKKEAAKLGASIVLITVDNFAMTPINNVNMVGTAYKK